MRRQTKPSHKAVIGVFDSGIGGKSVANAIQTALPDDQVIFASDTTHVPYGTKPPEEILGYVVPILNQLVAQGCEVIVIACNTVSTTLITQLRAKIPVPLIGMEPMVKPAAEQTRSKTIAVFATPTTLASKRYSWLKHTYANGVEVLEPDCSDWSRMIETNQVDRDKIYEVTRQVCSRGADVIVLGCTHYHWIEEMIQEAAADRATILQPERPVIAQLCRVLEQQT